MAIFVENPEHPIIKALIEKGYKNVWALYYPHWSNDWGWSVEGDNISMWLGYNKKQALKKIKTLT